MCAYLYYNIITRRVVAVRSNPYTSSFVINRRQWKSYLGQRTNSDDEDTILDHRRPWQTNVWQNLRFWSPCSVKRRKGEHSTARTSTACAATGDAKSFITAWAVRALLSLIINTQSHLNQWVHARGCTKSWIICRPTHHQKRIIDIAICFVIDEIIVKN